ncbi:putative complex 1 LYR protein [Helianthus anomalus]
MATAVPPPSRKQILSLFRSFFRSSRLFTDYNIREYRKCRTIDEFRHNKTLTNPSSVPAAFADGNYQLQVAKRQALVYHISRRKSKASWRLSIDWCLFMLLGFYDGLYIESEYCGLG